MGHLLSDLSTAPGCPISPVMDCGGHQVALKETDINVSIVLSKHSWPLVYRALVGPS